MRRYALLACVFCVSAWADGPPSADIAGLATSLASRERVSVSGEEAHFIPRDAVVPTQYDTFTLKFDRPGKRLRLVYSRFLNKSMRIDVDAWGTLDCLNTVRVERTPPAFVNPKMQTCVKFDSLYSVLSENAAGYSPSAIMRGEIESKLLAEMAGQRDTEVSLGHDRGMLVLSGVYHSPQKSYVTRHEWKYAFNEKGTELMHVVVDDDGMRARANYEHTDAKFADSDFAYVPAPLLVALADFNKTPDGPARAVLEQDAAKGSMTARLALSSREPTVVGMAYGIGIDDPQKTWAHSTELAELGVASMYTMQGQLLARMPARALQYLPQQFRSMTADQRKLEAAKLVWKGAEGCDPQALDEAGRGLAIGGDIFDPNPLKQNELATIKHTCDQKTTLPELLNAAGRFKTPWP